MVCYIFISYFIILILDDRDDVWEYSESLVRIRPYKFFSEVDDINAPPTAPRGSVKKLDSEEVVEGKEPDEGSKAEVEKREVTPPISTTPVEAEDTDDVLEDVERVLTDVHKAFFEHYDKTKEVCNIALWEKIKNYILLFFRLLMFLQLSRICENKS